MGRWILVVIVALVGCQERHADGDLPPKIDAGFVPGDGLCGLTAYTSACDVLMQTGCNAGRKCTWFEDDTSDPPLGHLGCAPLGTVVIGGSCAHGTPGCAGYDDCVQGAVCVAGVCEAICDPQGGPPSCGVGLACTRIAGLFGAVGSMTPSAAGVCERTCDPLADNDYDGSGSDSVRTGSACGSDPGVGCYGLFSDSGDPTYFRCARPVAAADRVHRGVLTMEELYLSACHPGYTIRAYYSDSSGSIEAACYAFCSPGNSYLGATTQLPNGKPGGECRVGSNARQGLFGTPASETANGEHCMYSWAFEVDENHMLHRSPTSDTVGICFDHTKYTYDDDGNAATPLVEYPRCASVPLHDPVTLDAVDLGCVDTVTAGFPAGPTAKTHPKFKLMLPTFDHAPQ